jgi:hypothetical protein
LKIFTIKKTKDLFITLFLKQFNVKTIRDLPSIDRERLIAILNKIPIKTHRELREEYFLNNGVEMPKRKSALAGRKVKPKKVKKFKFLSPDGILYEGSN